MSYSTLVMLFDNMLAGTGQDLGPIPSRQGLVPSHPIPSRPCPIPSRSHAKPGLGASIPQRFGPIPVPRRDGTVPGRDIPVLVVSLTISTLLINSPPQPDLLMFAIFNAHYHRLNW